MGRQAVGRVIEEEERSRPWSINKYKVRAIQFGLGLNKWKKVREIIIMICWGLAGRQADRQTGTVTVQGHRRSA